VTWFKVDDSFHSHPKVLAADPAALGLWVVAGAWCGANLTDGFVPDHVLPRLLPDPAELAQQLVTCGLWRRSKGGYRFHDWGDYNPNSSAVKKERDAARDRMRKLRANRKPKGQAANGSGEQQPNVRENFAARSQPRPDPTRSSSNEELEKASPSTSEIATRPSDTAIERPEIERICEHLADRIEANGAKRPTITKKWRDAARLMLERDNRTEEQIRGAIDWSQDSEFWRANVMSLPKLREKYDTLRLQAQRDRGANGSVVSIDRRQQATNDLFDRAMQRAIAREEGTR
jgi:hypothetical protein